MKRLSEITEQLAEKIQKEYFEGRNDGQRAYENIHFILARKGSKATDSYAINI